MALGRSTKWGGASWLADNRVQPFFQLCSATPPPRRRPAEALIGSLFLLPSPLLPHPACGEPDDWAGRDALPRAEVGAEPPNSAQPPFWRRFVCAHRGTIGTTTGTGQSIRETLILDYCRAVIRYMQCVADWIVAAVHSLC